MRIAIVSKSDRACRLCRSEAERFGFTYDENAPEVVLTYGGDGTLLHAERIYPGIPKLPLRNSQTSQKTEESKLDQALNALKAGTVTKEVLPKLEVVIGETRLLALNDVFFRNKNIEHAVRFNLRVGERSFEGLIGDGLLVATPFGSTAYFQSITKERFDQGLGLAFINLVQQEQPLFLEENEVIEVEMLRGPAELAADNARHESPIETGRKFSIKQSAETATLLHLRKE